MKMATFLTETDAEALRKALGIVPDNLNGSPYQTKVRRGEIERRRISLIKAENPAPNQSESQELYRLCRYKQYLGEFSTIGWALRSRVSGDYFVFSEVW